MGVTQRQGRTDMGKRQKVSCIVGDSRDNDLGVLCGQLALNIGSEELWEHNKKVDAGIDRDQLKTVKRRGRAPSTKQCLQNSFVCGTCTQSSKHLLHGSGSLFAVPTVFYLQNRQRC